VSLNSGGGPSAFAAGRTASAASHAFPDGPAFAAPQPPDKAASAANATLEIDL